MKRRISVLIYGNYEGEFMKIGKKEYSLKIKLKGIEPVFVYKTKEPRYTIEGTFALFYPIRRFKHKIKCKLDELAFSWLNGKPPIKCAFCGESIAVRKIPDPNGGSNKILDVCQHCYDWVGKAQFESFVHFMEMKGRDTL